MNKKINKEDEDIFVSWYYKNTKDVSKQCMFDFNEAPCVLLDRIDALKDIIKNDLFFASLNLWKGLRNIPLKNTSQTEAINNIFLIILSIIEYYKVRENYFKRENENAKLTLKLKKRNNTVNKFIEYAKWRDAQCDNGKYVPFGKQLAELKDIQEFLKKHCNRRIADNTSVSDKTAVKFYKAYKLYISSQSKEDETFAVSLLVSQKKKEEVAREERMIWAINTVLNSKEKGKV